MNRLDLIIDALEQADRMRRKQGHTEEYLQEALAAARELRELKPVAWMLPEYGDVLSASEADGTGIYNIPLYTAPTKREWVGLTDDEIFKDDEIMVANSGYGANFENLRELTKAIESAVRRKNT